MSQYSSNGQYGKRFVKVMVLSIVTGLVLIMGACSNNQEAEQTVGVPWDYRVEKAVVGELIDGDMVILPDNEMLPNDENYATGDTIWTLQYMGAQMVTGSDGKNEVTLTAWEPIKSFKTEQAAKEDMDKLKIQLNAEVDLVGVYQTELNGKKRQFAVVTLPSGNQVKQPIDEERYQQLKTMKKVNVMLEEVHDFSDYDMAYAKFKGWAS
ncbi:signal peptide protein [Paenibacillus sp. GCM10027626]|uniref:signal peptide protein n=1 Tax=Paenibacillus sp. GCM10027626 TaxID=3273411 RepID=UPI0036252E85